MKNRIFICMLIPILLAISIFVGFFLGRVNSKNTFGSHNIAQASNETFDEIKTINLNSANESELSLYLDIDRSLAIAIVQYRETFGKYVYVSELKNVPGMTESTYNKIKQYVTIIDP